MCGYATAAEWRKHLSPYYAEALEDMNDELMTPNEVLYEIIRWNGGLASAVEARVLVKEVYGLNLDDYNVVTWKS